MVYRSKLDNFLVKMAIDNKSVKFKENITIKNINPNENEVVFKDKNMEHKVNYDILVGY